VIGAYRVKPITWEATVGEDPMTTKLSQRGWTARPCHWTCALAWADEHQGQDHEPERGKARCTMTEPCHQAVNRAKPVIENDEYAAFVGRVLRAYARRIADGDIESLTYMTGLADDIEAAIRDAVTGLRDIGYSWTEIGSRLGVTGQAAQQRWGTQPAINVPLTTDGSGHLGQLTASQDSRSGHLTAEPTAPYKRGVIESLRRSLHIGVHECHDLPEPGPVAVGGVDFD